MLPNSSESALRELFPITKRFTYLNHAAVSPLPLPTLQAVEAQLKDVHDYGSINFLDWLSTKGRRAKIARSTSRRAAGTDRLNAEYFRRAFDRRQRAYVATR